MSESPERNPQEPTRGQETEASVSIAIPLFNEQDGIAELIRRVIAVVDQLPGDNHQVILVDDGSTDQTWQRISLAAEADPRLVALSFSRNFGHQAACAAGLRYANGDVCVLMDGDLQDPPEQIPRMLKHFYDGNAVVYAIREKRKESVLLRSCYFLFYRVMGALAERPMPMDAGDFCLMSRKVVDVINQSRERQRYLRGMRAWVGFQQIGITVERDVRAAGSSKYSWRKLFGLAIDGIFAHSVLPLRAAILLGTLAIAASVLVGGHALYGKLVSGDSPPGYTALAITIIFFAGVQLVFLGVIGEYVGRIFEEVKRRPSFIIDRMIADQTNCDP